MLEFKSSVAKVQTPYELTLAKFQEHLLAASPHRSQTYHSFENYIEWHFSKRIDRNILETSGIIEKKEKLPSLLVLINYFLHHDKNKLIFNAQDQNLRLNFTNYFLESDKNTQFALLILFAVGGLSEAQETLSEIISSHPLEADFWNAPLSEAKGLTPFWILSKLASSNTTFLAVSFYLALMQKKPLSLLDWNRQIKSEKKLADYFSIQMGTSPFSLLCRAPLPWREEVLKRLFTEIPQDQLDWTAGITVKFCNRSPFWVLTTHAVKGEKWAQDIFDSQILNHPLAKLDGWHYSEKEHKTPYEQLSEEVCTSIWAAKTKAKICNHPSFFAIAFTSFATHNPAQWGIMAIGEFLNTHDIAKINWNETIQHGPYQGASLFAILFKFASFAGFDTAMLNAAVMAASLLERILTTIPLHLLDWDKKRENHGSDHSPFQHLITLNGTIVWKAEILSKLINQGIIMPGRWNERLSYSLKAIATPLHYLIKRAQLGQPDLLIAFLLRKEYLEVANFNLTTKYGYDISLDLTPSFTKAIFLLRGDYKSPKVPFQYSNLTSKLSYIFCKYWNFANTLGVDMPLLIMHHYVKSELNPILADIPLQLHEIIVEAVISRLQKEQMNDNDVTVFNESASEIAEALSKKSYTVTSRVAALRRSGYTKYPSVGIFGILIEAFNHIRGTSDLVGGNGKMQKEADLIHNTLQSLSNQGNIPAILDREEREEVINHLVHEKELARANVENKVTQALLFTQCRKRGLTVIKLDREAPSSKKIKLEISPF